MQSFQENSGFSNVITPIYNSGNAFMPFLHALRIALASKGELEIVDVRTEQETTEHFGVRSLLEKWGVIAPGAHRNEVELAGLRVKKIVREGNKRREIIKRLNRHNHNLLVIGTQADQTVFSEKIAEFVSDYFHQNTLFIPPQSRPFVSEQSGNISLNTILVPFHSADESADVFKTLRDLLALFPQSNPKIILLHVGTTFPDLDPELLASLRVRKELKNGKVIEAILSAAHDHDADLIVMQTRGQESIVEKIVGTTASTVVRNCSCPVLAMYK